MQHHVAGAPSPSPVCLRNGGALSAMRVVETHTLWILGMIVVW